VWAEDLAICSKYNNQLVQWLLCGTIHVRRYPIHHSHKTDFFTLRTVICR